jgi:hypothetical protein
MKVKCVIEQKLQLCLYLGVDSGHKNRITNQGMKSKGNPDQAGLTVKICSLCLGAHVISHSAFSHAFLY